MGDTLILNEKDVRFEHDESIIDTESCAGVEIPMLCYLKWAMPTDRQS